MPLALNSPDIALRNHSLLLFSSLNDTRILPAALRAPTMLQSFRLPYSRKEFLSFPSLSLVQALDMALLLGLRGILHAPTL